jgi:hypothetical protein
MYDPHDEEMLKLFPTHKFGCAHKYTHLCDGSEELMHLLYRLGLKSPFAVLKDIGISVEGKRYFWNGSLVDRGYWPENNLWQSE